jgi:hypothetical protein
MPELRTDYHQLYLPEERAYLRCTGVLMAHRVSYFLLEIGIALRQGSTKHGPSLAG